MTTQIIGTKVVCFPHVWKKGHIIPGPFIGKDGRTYRITSHVCENCGKTKYVKRKGVKQL